MGKGAMNTFQRASQLEHEAALVRQLDDLLRALAYYHQERTKGPKSLVGPLTLTGHAQFSGRLKTALDGRIWEGSILTPFSSKKEGPK